MSRKQQPWPIRHYINIVFFSYQLVDQRFESIQKPNSATLWNFPDLWYRKLRWPPMLSCSTLVPATFTVEIAKTTLPYQPIKDLFVISRTWPHKLNQHSTFSHCWSRWLVKLHYHLPALWGMVDSEVPLIPCSSCLINIDEVRTCGHYNYIKPNQIPGSPIYISVYLLARSSASTY